MFIIIIIIVTLVTRTNNFHIILTQQEHCHNYNQYTTHKNVTTPS